MYDLGKKKEVEIYFKSNNTTIAQTARRFSLPYTTVKSWVNTHNWIAGSAINTIDTIQKDVVINNFDIVTNKAREDIKQEVINNLGSVAFSVDKIVLDSLIDESSEAILLKAMSLNHINKSLALNASIAKNTLLHLTQNNDGSLQSKVAIIACSEKVSKIFIDLKTSLYGKDVLSENNKTLNYENLSDAELIELLDKCEEKEQ